MNAIMNWPEKQIADFCRKWKITELSLFGSALRDDFRPDSDIDLLVSFGSDSEWSLFDHARMEQELSGILGRKVDLVSRRALESSANPIRRKAILENTRRVYVSG